MKRIGTAALAAGALAMLAPAAVAQSARITARTLIDRAEIEDLLTRYYYNLGHAGADSFARFYADDAELVLGDKTYKGMEGIGSAYKSTGDSPQRRAAAFNISISNPLIVVTGATATAQLIFTEVIVDKAGDPPRLLVQGREYDWLVKTRDGWRIRKRQIMPGAQVPPGWGE